MSVLINLQHKIKIGMRKLNLLQTVTINNQSFTLFFNNRCSDFVVRKSAIKRPGPYAAKVFDGPINIGGFGGTSTKSSHGIYNINIPIIDSQIVSMVSVLIK